MGCGRIAFDPLATCEPVGHDEDRDGFDDACDGCPHIAEADQRDGDRDGVNDPCDPFPFVARERIAFFDPFVAQRPEWRFSGMSPSFIGDSLFVDTRALSIRASQAIVPATDDITMAGHLGAARTTNRGVTISAWDPGPGVLYCELFGDATKGKVAFTYTLDMMTWMEVVASYGGVIENGDFLLEMRHGTADVGCYTTWPVPMPYVLGPLPTDIAPTELGFDADGIELRLDYYIQIHTE